MLYKIINLSKNTILAERAELANTFFNRMKGLLLRKSLESSSGLIIQPTSSIHTFFMHFPIDIIFLDKDNRIVKLRNNVPPFRFITCPLTARTTIELPAGTLNFTRTQTGDLVTISKLSQ